MICSTLLTMISLVVCSIRPEQLARLKESVAGTIGVPHEWIVIDNRGSGKGICQAYNEGAAKALYPFILFVHEDVTFDQPGWGERAIANFNNDAELGLVGVAGSTVKSRSFSGWYTGDARYDRFRLRHAGPSHVEDLYQLPDPATAVFPVVCLDGVFLLMRKSVWELIPFNAQTIKGFHFYDIDLSLRVAQRFKVGVMSSVGLVHHTAAGGDYGNRWIQEAIDFHRRWQGQLPRSVAGTRISELDVKRIWLDRLKDQAIDFRDRLRWVVYDQSWRRPALLYSILKFFLYHPLRLRYIHRYFRKSMTAA